MTPDAIKQLQICLKVSPTGVLDDTTITAMNGAVGKALSQNDDVVKMAGNNTADSILNAYTSGDWSGVVDLTGKPFTRKQQNEAVAAAEKAYKPGFDAQQTYDRSQVEQTLAGDAQGFDQFLKDEGKQFGRDKDTLDNNAVDQGILFAGSRMQKLNDLRNTYEDRQAIERQNVGNRIQSTGRNYHYTYGDDNTRKISDMFKLPSGQSYNPNVSGGKVSPTGGISSMYNMGSASYQGTVPVSQKAAVQTRAAGLLTNRANKLTSTGYKNQF